MLIVIPTIQHGPQVFSTIEGIPVTLPCRAIGVPTPEISWAKVGFAVMFVVVSYSVSLTPPPILAFFSSCDKKKRNLFSSEKCVHSVVVTLCNKCEKESNNDT